MMTKITDAWLCPSTEEQYVNNYQFIWVNSNYMINNKYIIQNTRDSSSSSSWKKIEYV